MTDTQAAANDRPMMPADPAMAASRPGNVRALTGRELRSSEPAPGSGWYKQQAVYPALSEPWKETSAVLEDLHAAWRLRWQAEHEPEAGQ